MSAGKGKRGADGPLAATSSSSSGSSDEDSPRRPPLICSGNSFSAAPPPSTDCSTASSSTAAPAAGGDDVLLGGVRCRISKADEAGDDAALPSDVPTLSLITPRIGQPQQQQQEVRRPKLKKKRADTVDDFRLVAPPTSLQTTPRNKTHRDPLPMRMRALPQSFWQQPNRPHNVSPATIYAVLPPLVTRDGEDVTDLRPMTPPEEEEKDLKSKTSRSVSVSNLPSSRTVPSLSERLHGNGRQSERSVTVSNAELLYKLFDVVEKDGKRTMGQMPLGKKSRVRKHPTTTVVAHGSNFLSGRDPYLVDCIAEKLFPQLSLENSKTYASYGGNTTLQVLTLKEGDKTVALPSLTIEQNYPQMLSELVTHI